MRTIHILSIAGAILLSACGGKTTGLEAKKAELAKLKAEIAAMQAKAKGL